MEAYKHDFSGSCSPDGMNYTGQSTFSVGVFQWVPKSIARKGLKKSNVKVRVYGFMSKPDPVYAKARKIVEALDAGIYKGPKTVKIGTA